MSIFNGNYSEIQSNIHCNLSEQTINNIQKLNDKQAVIIFLIVCFSILMVLLFLTIFCQVNAQKTIAMLYVSLKHVFSIFINDNNKTDVYLYATNYVIEELWFEDITMITMMILVILNIILLIFMLYYDEIDIFIELIIGFITISLFLIFILITSYLGYKFCNDDLRDHNGDLIIIHLYDLDIQLKPKLSYKILAILWNSIGFIVIILIICGFYKLYDNSKFL